MHAQMVLAAEDEVGESIVWDAPSASLLWVDIAGRRIHRMRPSDGAHRVWRAPDFPTSIGLRTDGGAVVGLTDRVALWNYGNDFTTLALPEPDLPDNRLNEGRVAPDGSFWVGTMQNNLTADGRPKDMDRASGGLYRIDGDGGVTRLAPEAYGITNTMAWTDDGRFITADTLENRLYVYDMAADGMSLSGRKPFAEPLDRGLPDGSCLDARGYLWNCRVVGGSALARFAPDGSLDRIVDLPCSWPTSCTFGGPDLATLYVTSARFTMAPDHLAANPQEGGVFALDVGAAGRPEPRFRRRA